MSDQSKKTMGRLAALKPAFKEMNIKRLRVFGSLMKGDARPDSDVDLIVDFYKPPGLLGLSGMQLDLQKMLGIKVDLTTQKGLHPALKDRILAEARNV